MTIQQLQDRITADRLINQPVVDQNNNIDLTGTSNINNQIISDKTTVSALSNEINRRVDNLFNILNTLNPLPPNPMIRPEAIVENEKELNKVLKTPVQVYEEIMRSEGIPEKITELDRVRKHILAEVQVYDDMIKEVTTESQGIPEIIKQKRINRIEEARNKNLKALELQYSFLLDNYKMSLEMARYKMGLFEKEYEREEMRREKQKEDARMMLQQLINEGAISDLTDEELRNWARATGYTFTDLVAIRKYSRIGNETKLIEKLSNMLDKSESREREERKLKIDESKFALEKQRYETTDKKLDELSIDSKTLDNVLKTLKIKETQLNLANKRSASSQKLPTPKIYSVKELVDKFTLEKRFNRSYNEVLEMIGNDKSIINKSQAIDVLNAVYGKKIEPPKTNTQSEGKELFQRTKNFVKRIFGK